MSRADLRWPLLLVAPVIALALIILASVATRLDAVALTASANLRSLCMDAARLALAHLPHAAPGAAATAGLVVVGVLGLSSVVRQVRSSRALAQSLLQCEVAPLPESLNRIAAGLGLTGRIRVVGSPDFYAFCFGLLRPQICISTAVIEELTPSELEAVLRHESWHVSRRDPLRAVIANALATSLFFVPVLREFVRAHFVRRELNADTAAVREMRDSYPLASALYAAATKSGALPEPALATAGAFSALDARIDQLLSGPTASTAQLRPRPLAVYTSFLAVAAVSLIACLLVASPEAGVATRACMPC